MKGSLFTADMSHWLQKPLNDTTLTAVQGSSSDGVREKVGKMRRTGGDANLLRSPLKLMKHFLDDYPQVQSLHIGHSDNSQFALLRSYFTPCCTKHKQWHIWVFYIQRKPPRKYNLKEPINCLTPCPYPKSSQSWSDLCELPWVTDRLAGAGTFSFCHTKQTHHSPACTHVQMSTLQRWRSSHAVYSLFTSQGQRPLSVLTSAWRPTFLPSNMWLSYGVPAP